MIEKITATPEQVQEMLSALKQGVEGVVESKHDNIVPMIGVLELNPLTDERIAVLHAMDMGFNTVAEKKRAMKVIAAQVVKDNRIPLVAGLVAEAWMRSLKKDEGYENVSDYRKKYLQVADDPQRMECAVISALGFPLSPTESGPVKIACRQMKRGYKNRIEWDGEWFEADGGEAHILERLFEAFIKFALKVENYEHYLTNIKMEKAW